MKQYLDLIQYTLENGDYQINERTQEGCTGVTGTTLKWDLRKTYPAVTTKELFYKSAFGETIGFLQGKTNAADFRALGSKVWDQNANETPAWLANAFRKGEDDLGPIYGNQWRNWPAFKMQDDRISAHGDELLRQAKIDNQLLKEGWQVVASDHTDEHNVWFKSIDQVKEVLTKIIKTPSDRRILFHGWNPAMIDQMALPPCHLLYQFIPKIGVRNGQPYRELDLVVYIRSWDLFLGAPFNMAATAMMLHLFALLTGFRARHLTIQGGDVHIYDKHMDAVNQQLQREPLESPRLYIDAGVRAFSTYATDEENIEGALTAINNLKTSDFVLMDYKHHEKISAPMAK
ncbi:MAG: thymidylate synthase [Sulfuriferula sp.]|nr:thymidylate synthase [Sulfuriferula sp.]